MPAVLVTAFEGPDALAVREVPEPEAQDGQVLIDAEWAKPMPMPPSTSRMTPVM